MVVPKPVVLNVYTDPNVPMMPPHVSLQQIKAFSSAIYHGDSDAWDMIRQTAKDVWAEYFPGK
jgi:pyruvate dehydrogenase (quinone)